MIDSEPCWSRDPETDRPKTLLYVDDHAINLMLMRALLSHRPAWRLNMASDGEAACMIARSEPHDLLLLDLRLPDGHGTELLRRLRALPGLSKVPAVAVTAEDFHELSDTGFCEVWPKPLDLRVTLRRLDHFLGEDAGTRTSVVVGRPPARSPPVRPFRPCAAVHRSRALPDRQATGGHAPVFCSPPMASVHEATSPAFIPPSGARRPSR